jgi:hypothetical protein
MISFAIALTYNMKGGWLRAAEEGGEWSPSVGGGVARTERLALLHQGLKRVSGWRHFMHLDRFIPGAKSFPPPGTSCAPGRRCEKISAAAVIIIYGHGAEPARHIYARGCVHCTHKHSRAGMDGPRLQTRVWSARRINAKKMTKVSELVIEK